MDQIKLNQSVQECIMLLHKSSVEQSKIIENLTRRVEKLESVLCETKIKTSRTETLGEMVDRIKNNPDVASVDITTWETITAMSVDEIGC